MTYRDPVVSAGRARQVIAEVAARHSVPSRLIIADGKGSPETTRARHEVFVRLNDLGASFSSIAKLMDRDPSTISVAVRNYRARQQGDV